MYKPHGNLKLKIYNRYTHKKRKVSKYNTKDSHHIIREEKNEGTKTPKQLNKVSVITCLSKITSNVNELNAPIKRQSG